MCTYLFKILYFKRQSSLVREGLGNTESFWQKSWHIINSPGGCKTQERYAQ